MIMMRGHAGWCNAPLKVNRDLAQQVRMAAHTATFIHLLQPSKLRNRQLLLHAQHRERHEVVFKRLFSGEDTSLYSKEVAHSRYRGNDAVLLRHRTHALHRAHLRPLRVHMLLEPLLVRPAFLQHPIQIATELPRGGGLRLGLALRP